MSDLNQIQKKVLLKASRSRVWRALTDSQEFGNWFGMKLEGPFVAGTPIRGTISPTKADEKAAALQKPYEGLKVELWVDRIEPEKLFSFKWHPGAVDPAVDYSREPMTLITFTLEEQSGSILLTVTESGFENIPITRRAEVFKGNTGGWEWQMELIQKYLAAYAR